MPSPRPKPEGSKLTIRVGGTTVECDGPVEALDAVQRDAFEVRLPAADDAERDRRAAIVERWLRGDFAA